MKNLARFEKKNRTYGTHQEDTDKEIGMDGMREKREVENQKHVSRSTHSLLFSFNQGLRKPTECRSSCGQGSGCCIESCWQCRHFHPVQE